MANSKLTDLTALTTASADDLLYIVDAPGGSPVSRKITLNNLKLSSDAISRWEDLRVSLTSTKLGGSKDPGFTKILDNGSGSQGVFAYLFDAASEEEIYFSAQMPHSMKLESAITPHVHWCPVSNGSAGQTVSWGLEYSWQDIGSVFGNTSIVYSATHYPADSALVAKKHYITSFGEITGAGAAVSSVLVCRLFRDATGAGATDSYTADAAGLYMDFHIEMDSTGSVTELSKWGT